MSLRQINIALFTLLCIGFYPFKGSAQKSFDEKHVEVSLRMIGHQVLLNAGDSTSRVLPIIKGNDRYRVEFESEFDFIPEDLVRIVNGVVAETSLANDYIVEVEQCENKEIVYSYVMQNLSNSNITPCVGRIQPECCYSLIFTLKEPQASEAFTAATLDFLPGSKDKSGLLKYVAFFLLFLGMIGAVLFFRKRKKKSTIDPNLIQLGDYHFDKRNTELILEGERIELTSKEADLLILLYNAVNITVKREEILKMVWGDNGDYIGRTLDVFISKLRKKLEGDSNVKIVNIRGVGYKLVTNV